nr:hypothetical protein [Abalone asfa-like virus]
MTGGVPKFPQKIRKSVVLPYDLHKATKVFHINVLNNNDMLGFPLWENHGQALALCNTVIHLHPNYDINIYYPSFYENGPDVLKTFELPNEQTTISLSDMVDLIQGDVLEFANNGEFFLPIKQTLLTEIILFDFNEFYTDFLLNS